MLVRKIIHRLVLMVFTLFLLTIFCFLLLKKLPGGPFDDEAIPATSIKNQLVHYYGLDQPLHRQYINYLGNLLRGDLGFSLQNPQYKVSQIISKNLWVTLFYGFIASVLSIVLGIFGGVILIQLPSNVGLISESLIFFFLSTPFFSWVPALIYFFTIKWTLFPMVFSDKIGAWILPLLVLSIRPVLRLSLLLKNILKEVMQTQYIQTARAMGFSEKQILYRWALPNAMIPWFGYLGPLISHLLSGSVLVESLFLMPGMGRLYIQSIMERDYVLSLAVTLSFGIIVIIIHYLLDVLAFFVDPLVSASNSTREWW